MERRAAVKDGADETLRVDDETRFFAKLACRRLALALPCFGATARREPPAVIGIVDVVSQDEEDLAARVEHDAPAGVAVREAIGVKGPFVSHQSALTED